ncbi:MAG TPA: cyclodeaminase/cyclohydrolase family protein, partial [Aggregatilineales bacterium]|nr:cyclodeaminase/cyclohydrolase family protein [Aggregatilineales bacterium]
AIRFSNGGLRHVKALGLLVEGKAQVSMNLTNFTRTPIFRAVELIRREAQRYGVGIAYTELVGLAPEDSLIDAARWYLQLDAFQSDQLLERRLQSIPEPGPSLAEPPVPEGSTSLGPVIGAAQQTLSVYLDDVASATPTPGGGAVAALAGALGAALAAMVARLTIGKKKYAAAEAQMSAAIANADNLRQHLLMAMDEDVAAFNAVMAANKLDKSDPERTTAIQTALLRATETPLQVIKLALDVLKIARTVADAGNTNAATDAGVAAHVALAAVEGAALNVLVNVAGLIDSTQAGRLRDETERLVQEARALSADSVSLARTRAGLH